MPIYAIIGAGFVAGKALKVDRHSISVLLIYVVVPVVVFNALASTPVDAALLALPLVLYVLACTMAFTFYLIGRRMWSSSLSNVLGSMCGSGNVGYFGLPVVTALMGVNAQDIAIIGILGLILYENTAGYYLIAKSHVTVKGALGKLARLPAIYAAVLGISFRLFSLDIPETFKESITYFRGAYVVLGMMMVGLGLAASLRSHFDIRLVSASCIAKFAIYPLAMAAIVALDESVFHIFNERIHMIMMIFSITPLPANSVSYAIQLNVHPERVAMAVAFSTLFALAYIPVFVALFL